MAGFKKAKSLKRARFDEADDDTGNDVAAERAVKPAKKAKTASATSGKDDEGNSFWTLSANRRIGISNFKGKTLINIREYYTDASGDLKPGKKGISLSLEQYASLVKAIPSLNAELIEQGHEMPEAEAASAPQDTAHSSDEAEGAAPLVKKPAKKVKKANIEATSDEDDDTD
ncbi:transcriptional Coactivator p15-domain-containing protein [Microdochium trichocladiopsis]|uniref:Transcriptional Coactivator p15-domain-containing protein n=1 Tax=Microdochium trichocladiopsis TaxID=1682393 RepID=A0A9P9BMD4_9PEZI|nr:transcriptional Coactivator p15-domain-containing protein [Microdochium trichocladiopsis]KAH7026170.1 transcriptional Coactivator p15-domain-containing protein [Microdochium trichocladiopsis]